MSDPVFLDYPTRALVAEAAIERMEAALREALGARGQALMLASGGSTPGPAYAALSEAPLPWERVTVGLVDERRVEPTHALSNEALVRRTLLTGPAAAAAFLPMWRADGDLAAVEAAYAAAAWPADLVVLGMGEDGHTASWFPGAEGLEAATDAAGASRVRAIVAPAGSVAEPVRERITLTLPAIADARLALLLITGESKRATWERARADLLPVDLVADACGERLVVLWAP